MPVYMIIEIGSADATLQRVAEVPSSRASSRALDEDARHRTRRVPAVRDLTGGRCPTSR